MTTTPMYMIANFVIHDPDTYREYEKGFSSLLKRHGGEFVTFDDDAETVEGDNPPEGRIVVLRFPNEAAAHAWYDDPDYQAISEHRRAGSTLHFLTFVHGLSGDTPYADRT